MFLPTYASWPNWIPALRYSALNGTDHRSRAEQGDAIAGHMRWRNTRAQPKRDFAPDSVIRAWTDYKINVA